MAEQTLEQAQEQIRTLQGKVDTLETDNFNYRSKIRQKDQEIEGLKEKVPGDDKVVITKAESDELTSYRALGSVKDVTKSLKDGKDAQEAVKANERQTTLNEAAGSEFNSKALAKFLPEDAVLEKQGQGDKAKWVVKQGDTSKPLGEFVKGIEEETGVSLRTKPDKIDVGSSGFKSGDDKNKGDPQSFMEALAQDQR